MLAPYRVDHSREAYNLLDFIGDLGGVYEIIFQLFAIFISPITKYSFILRALQRLYIVKTKRKNLFKKASFEKKHNGKSEYKTLKRKIPE